MTEEDLLLEIAICRNLRNLSDTQTAWHYYEGKAIAYESVLERMK